MTTPLMREKASSCHSLSSSSARNENSYDTVAMRRHSAFTVRILRMFFFNIVTNPTGWWNYLLFCSRRGVNCIDVFQCRFPPSSSRTAVHAHMFSQHSMNTTKKHYCCRSVIPPNSLHTIYSTTRLDMLRHSSEAKLLLC